jgi:hypothetical protein
MSNAGKIIRPEWVPEAYKATDKAELLPASPKLNQPVQKGENRLVKKMSLRGSRTNK